MSVRNTSIDLHKKKKILAIKVKTWKIRDDCRQIEVACKETVYLRIAKGEELQSVQVAGEMRH